MWGLIRLEDEALVVEWSGSTKVSDVRGFAADVRVEPFPAGCRAIPLAAVSSILRRGWSWQPRIELRVTELRVLEGVPGVAGSLLTLAIPHTDLDPAGRLVIAAGAIVRALPVPGRRDRGSLASGTSTVHYRGTP